MRMLVLFSFVIFANVMLEFFHIIVNHFANILNYDPDAFDS